jgi:hypothetical protein
MTTITSGGGAAIVPPIAVPGGGEPLASVTPARDWLLQRMVRARGSDPAAMAVASKLYNALAPFGDKPDVQLPADIHARLAEFAAS